MSGAIPVVPCMTLGRGHVERLEMVMTYFKVPYQTQGMRTTVKYLLG